MVKSILLYIENSSNVQRAVDIVINIQKIFDSKVVTFCAIEKRFPVIISAPFTAGTSNAYTFPMNSFKKDLKQSESEAKNLLEKIKKLFFSENLSVETRLIKSMSPDEYIRRSVEKEYFDLIVLGCKDESSKIKRIFKKTLSQKVLKKTTCDVLVIR